LFFVFVFGLKAERLTEGKRRKYKHNKEERNSQAVVAHAFNPSTWEAGRWISEFEASLVYSVISGRAKTAQRNSVSKNKKQKTKQQKSCCDHNVSPQL
jgi:hypothetical protein